MPKIKLSSILKKGKRLRAVKIPNSKKLKSIIQKTGKEQEKILSLKNLKNTDWNRPMDL